MRPISAIRATIATSRKRSVCCGRGRVLNGVGSRWSAWRLLFGQKRPLGLENRPRCGCSRCTVVYPLGWSIRCVNTVDNSVAFWTRVDYPLGEQNLAVCSPFVPAAILRTSRVSSCCNTIGYSVAQRLSGSRLSAACAAASTGRKAAMIDRIARHPSKRPAAGSWAPRDGR